MIMKTFYSLLRTSNRETQKTVYFCASGVGKVAFLMLLLTIYTGTVNAQETNVGPTQSSSAAATTSSAKSASTALTADQSALNPKLKEIGIKINLLLTQVQNHLEDASNMQWFSENLQSSLSAKSAQVCPNIALVDLVMGTQSFILTPEMDKQELLYAIDFLKNMSFNGMLTK
tara:strand:+ start:57 stop:575 length:519 start_codon:yes stop_codon:yes gene_type:complete